MSRRPRQPEDTSGEEGFLNRWSWRKGQTRPSSKSQDEAQPDAELPERQEPVKHDEDMPPIEDIDDTSDVSDFFSPGVSESLRKAALRKFFHSPAFNIVDGLDDYDDDFTTFKALGDIVTADMRHQMEIEKERKEARRQEDTEAKLSSEAQKDLAESSDDAEKDTVTPSEAESEHEVTQSDAFDDSGDTLKTDNKEKREG